MSFAAYEESTYHGEPVNLYLFRYGAGLTEYYAYSDTEIPLTISGVTYAPVPLERDAFNSSGTLDKSDVSIHVDADNSVAEMFRVYAPTQPVTLVVRQGHIGDPDSEYNVVWTGRVLSCSWVDSVATLTCEPVATSMQRTGLRRHYQYGCPHALYMGDATGGCRADKGDATRATTVSSVTGSLVTLPTGWNGAFAKQKFIGGMVEWNTPGGSVERRSILKVVDGTNVVTMGGPIPDMEAGDAVAVVLGCNHQMTDCADLHNNINDFGGQPWIPTKSPFGNTQNFY
jgi:hypothetical protein